MSTRTLAEMAGGGGTSAIGGGPVYSPVFTPLAGFMNSSWASVKRIPCEKQLVGFPVFLDDNIDGLATFHVLEEIHFLFDHRTGWLRGSVQLLQHVFTQRGGH